ncbi:MAG: hypothetical protein D6791_06725 [Chloroflexi bacterium]|nr:MAG: hypothetical protein D6791_06725 [Chloroflexota bacterium]
MPASPHVLCRVLIPRDLAAGQYQVELGLYDRGTGQRRPVFQAGMPASDRLLVGPVTVRSRS